MLLFLFKFILLSSSAFADDPCLKWFQDGKISKGKGCETKCSSLSSNMGTFHCNSRCDEFCKEQEIYEKVLGNFLYYPGLSEAEKSLVKAYPKDALAIYKAKQMAEDATLRKFDRNAQEDESDAFRHFVWAAAIRMTVTPDITKKFLDAHESKKVDSDPEKAMDLANNRAGLLAADRLEKAGKLNLSEIEKSALEELKNRTLIVLKPRGGPR